MCVGHLRIRVVTVETSIFVHDRLTIVDLHASVAYLLEAWLDDEGAGRSVGAFSRSVEKFPLNFHHYYLIENSRISSVLWM